MASSPASCAIARDDERACRDERRLLNRLRADLLVTFPAALAIAGEDLGATRSCGRWDAGPPPRALATASREEIIEFGRAQRTGYLARFADRIPRAGRRPLHRAGAPGPAEGRHHPAHRPPLLLIDAQRRTWKRMASSSSALPAAGGGPAGASVSWRRDYLSFPGLGRRLAARIAGEVGEHIEQFTTPNSLPCYAGRAPVPAAPASATLSSRAGSPAPATSPTRCTNGRSPACALRLGQGLQRHPAHPRQNHHAALRALGNRWLECSGTASPTTPSPGRPRRQPQPGPRRVTSSAA